MRTALLQITSSDDPEANVAMLRMRLQAAAADGAGFILTPEVSNCLSGSRTRQMEVLRPEAEDATLAMAREEAARLGVWVLLGSLALKPGGDDDRLANRSLMIDPSGEIVGRYDKIHMFDVALSEEETYRESATFRPGTQACLVPTPFGTVGLTICYDLRFPYIYRALAQAGAEILTVPAAFSTVSGPAHWEVLCRARAIETGCFVLAPAQTGTHPSIRGRVRQTFGHSCAVDPWGRVIAQANGLPQTLLFDIRKQEVAAVRQKLPSISADQDFAGPK